MTNEKDPDLAIVDVKSINFSIPTISADVPKVLPLTQNTGEGELVLHEDEWAQIEFYPLTQLEAIKHILTEYEQFEKSHRLEYGWNEIYLRRIKRTPVISGYDAISRLADMLDTRVDISPILTTTSTVIGRVESGFTLPLGSGVSLYGSRERACISVLGAYLHSGADPLRLTQAFVKLNQSNDFVLVDWISQIVLVGMSAAGDIKVWKSYR
jgi:hypothetical protein